MLIFPRALLFLNRRWRQRAKRTENNNKYQMKKKRCRGRLQTNQPAAMLPLLQSCGRLLTVRSIEAVVSRSVCSAQMSKRVAVVLAGCGVYDGSEIHEASAILVHLSRGGASVSSSQSVIRGHVWSWD